MFEVDAVGVDEVGAGHWFVSADDLDQIVLTGEDAVLIPISFVDADTGRTIEVRVTASTDSPAMRSTDIQIRRDAPSKRQ